MRRYKNWIHKTSSRDCLTIWRPILPGFPWAQGASFMLSTLNFFRRCWRSAAAAARDLILVEADGKHPSVQSLSCSVVSDSSRPHGLQHVRRLCPSPAPGVYSNSCPSRWWCHPTISSYHPLLLLPSIFPSIRVFSNGSVLRIRWPRYWSFSFSISPSSEYSALISFRMGWLDLLAVQGTLKNLLQHHSSKASILQRSAFFIVQLSHPYITTGKTLIALTRRTFVCKVMPLLFNMLSGKHPWQVAFHGPHPPAAPL